MSEEVFKITYDYEDNYYEVEGDENFHFKLQSESDFRRKFFEIELNKNQEIVHVEEEQYESNDKHGFDESYEIGDISDECDNKENDGKFIWDLKSTKFLLNKYEERRHRFRNPKQKKSLLWKEIQKEFETAGFKDSNSERLDRKMRNLKIRFKALKNEKHKTGRGRPSWIWFNQMYNIFYNDKSVTFDRGISSMTDFIDKPVDCSISCSELDSSLSNEILPNSEDIEKDLSSNASTTNDKYSKLSKQRSVAIQIEKEKLETLKSIRSSIISNSLNQSSLNSTLENQTRRTAAMEERNKVLKRKNELLERKNDLLCKLIESQTRN
ncbi:uncharacterized protein [Prorops nasuta]|uniref:uncharacterized protein n=1 Tax=Prorops nasuta TaxID=863751 RepID=UPI0034D00AA5